MNEKAEKKQVLPWVIVGILTLALIGGIIYAYRDLNQASASATNQAGTTRAGQRNPAMRAATGLLRLQQDQKLALTADQKTKLIPLIQDLKNTANPSAQFLQDKATAIEQVLTDEQKTFLNQRQAGQGGSNQWGGQQGAGATQGQESGQRPAQGQGSRQFNQADLYDRVLLALQQ